MNLRQELIEKFGKIYEEHINNLTNCGITYLQSFFSADEVCKLQTELKEWEKTKSFNIDNHMSFDGNSNEQYIKSSKAFSEAIGNPLLMAISAGALNQHPRLGFARVYCIDKIENYEKRAFAWHHDGWGKTLIKCMIFLSDVQEDGQRMRFCSGTQHINWDCNTSKHTQFVDSFVNQFKYVNCSGKAGDVYIFYPHSIHAGTRNLKARRDVLVINFLPGLSKNYQLSGFHPDIIQNFSQYERLTFRIDSENEYDLNELNYQQCQQDYLKKASNAFNLEQLSHKVNLKERLVFNNTKNQEIHQIAQFNQNVHLQKPIFKADCEIEQTNFFQNFINQNHIFGQIISEYSQEQIIELMQYQMQIDIERDLDLPVNMDHPFKDKFRDNVITRI